MEKSDNSIVIKTQVRKKRWLNWFEISIRVVWIPMCTTALRCWGYSTGFRLKQGPGLCDSVGWSVFLSGAKKYLLKSPNEILCIYLLHFSERIALYSILHVFNNSNPDSHSHLQTSTNTSGTETIYVWLGLIHPQTPPMSLTYKSTPHTCALNPTPSW